MNPENTHALTCSAEGCEYKIEVQAQDEVDAVNKIATLAMAHNAEAHPEATAMEPEAAKQDIKSRLKTL